MTSVILHRKGTALRSVGNSGSHLLSIKSLPQNPCTQHVPVDTFHTSVVHMDYFSLPNSPKKVQKLYWLCLQEHLIPANFQEPCRLILGSTGDNGTRADAQPAGIQGRASTRTNHLQLGQVRYALFFLRLSETYKGPICKSKVSKLRQFTQSRTVAAHAGAFYACHLRRLPLQYS